MNKCSQCFKETIRNQCESIFSGLVKIHNKCADARSKVSQTVDNRQSDIPRRRLGGNSEAEQQAALRMNFTIILRMNAAARATPREISSIR